MGDATKHPAKYSLSLIPLFAEALDGCATVLDPFAGVGRIHMLREYGFETLGVELEPEWALQSEHTDIGNALDLQFVDSTFDAVCTSPTYGNRFADKHVARDGSSRRGYTHDIGRQLSVDNSGALQWGPEYRMFHLKAWLEAVRVLKPGGVFVLNIKDHIRGGKRQFVSGWHVTALCNLGLTLERHLEVQLAGLRLGANASARLANEFIYVFRKGES